MTRKLDDLCLTHIKWLNGEPEKCLYGAARCLQAHDFNALKNVKQWVLFEHTGDMDEDEIFEGLGDMASHRLFKLYYSAHGYFARMGDQEDAKHVLDTYWDQPYNSVPLDKVSISRVRRVQVIGHNPKAVSRVSQRESRWKDQAEEDWHQSYPRHTAWADGDDEDEDWYPDQWRQGRDSGAAQERQPWVTKRHVVVKRHVVGGSAAGGDDEDDDWYPDHSQQGRDYQDPRHRVAKRHVVIGDTAPGNGSDDRPPRSRGGEQASSRHQRDEWEEEKEEEWERPTGRSQRRFFPREDPWEGPAGQDTRRNEDRTGRGARDPERPRYAPQDRGDGARDNGGRPNARWEDKEWPRSRWPPGESRAEEWPSRGGYDAQRPPRVDQGACRAGDDCCRRQGRDAPSTGPQAKRSCPAEMSFKEATEHYADQVALLEDMGFGDDTECVRLLVRFDGDVQKVVDEFMANPHSDLLDSIALGNPTKRKPQPQAEAAPAVTSGRSSAAGSWRAMFGSAMEAFSWKEPPPQPERKTQSCSSRRPKTVLTPSKIPCLSNIVTLNVAAGCLHKCVYCYAGCYDTKHVKALAHLPRRIKDELSTVSEPPSKIYFSPTCDAFQPDDEVQDVTYGIIRNVFDANRTTVISFLTKGIIRQDTLALLARQPKRVYAQIGLNSADDALLERMEPGGAPASERLRQVKRLLDAGIRTTVRMDPLFPGITDTDENLEQTFSAISELGVKDVTVSYLFLRHHIRRNVSRADGGSFQTMLRLYNDSTEVKFSEESTPIQVPETSWRARRYKAIQKLAHSYGLRPHICKCKNHDIEDIEELVPACDGCQIAGPDSACHGRKA
eukprot:CAMPEP_0174380058 /NCGR_PEP_ID=MMETSP0811_2-20130205/123125_1 /TAXON_ID=73025 ORGANISM="Eutreptiella gymnastica-like, Strain CCMP1594" /NCGR_SAMPLE_ID=MMETSP0811_2 /ASSEMBLY_ACC=CAM_ASM_000667 /LENGTH=836 /DNA_ID=CAMNT_0015532807 /DNA_START=23 /DNA_END=2533 /DNA_ORIENTATION=-